MKKLYIILAISTFVILATSCFNSDPYYPPVQSCFTTDHAEYLLGEEIRFLNCSRNMDYPRWDFGDGGTSNVIDPIYYYTRPGVYTVTLTSYGLAGDVVSSQATIRIIKPYPPVQACFTTEYPDYFTGEIINFHNCSQNFDYVSWNFGDGTISDLINPAHVYTAPGLYPVVMTAYGLDGSVQVRQSNIQVTTSTTSLGINVMYDGTSDPVIGSSVRIYRSQSDFDNEINIIAEGVTDEYGYVEFTGLTNINYFVDAYKDATNGIGSYNNWDLGIMTDPLILNKLNVYDIFVEYVATKKKNKSKPKVLKATRHFVNK